MTAVGKHASLRWSHQHVRDPCRDRATTCPRQGRRHVAGGYENARSAPVRDRRRRHRRRHGDTASAHDAGYDLSQDAKHNGQVAGMADFYHHGEWLYAMDIARDGYRTVAWLEWKRADGGWAYASVHDATGADDQVYGKLNPSLPEGKAVYPKACLRKGKHGSHFGCSAWEHGHA